MKLSSQILLLVLGAALAGCSDSSSNNNNNDQVTPEPVTPDPAVLLQENGDIVVQVSGRTLFAKSIQLSLGRHDEPDLDQIRLLLELPADQTPLARNFTETSSGIGVITFTRSDENADPLTVVSSTQLNDSVELKYENADGSRTATLEAMPVNDTESLFRFTLSGPTADSLAVPVRCDEDGSCELLRLLPPVNRVR